MAYPGGSLPIAGTETAPGIPGLWEGSGGSSPGQEADPAGSDAAMLGDGSMADGAQGIPLSSSCRAGIGGGGGGGLGTEPPPAHTLPACTKAGNPNEPEVQGGNKEGPPIPERKETRDEPRITQESGSRQNAPP